MSRVSLRVGKEEFEIQSEVPNCPTTEITRLQEQQRPKLDAVNERGKVHLVKHTETKALAFFAKKTKCPHQICFPFPETRRLPGDPDTITATARNLATTNPNGNLATQGKLFEIAYTGPVTTPKFPIYFSPNVIDYNGPTHKSMISDRLPILY